MFSYILTKQMRLWGGSVEHIHMTYVKAHEIDEHEGVRYRAYGIQDGALARHNWCCL
jgi:hypothetical protein